MYCIIICIYYDIQHNNNLLYDIIESVLIMAGDNRDPCNDDDDK